MPSTAGVTIGMPPTRVGNEANFQLQEEYTRWEAVSLGPAEKIPMFHADFPGFTLKIVEHSHYLLVYLFYQQRKKKTTPILLKSSVCCRTPNLGVQDTLWTEVVKKMLKIDR